MNNNRIARAQEQREAPAIRPVDRLKEVLGREDILSRLQESVKENSGAFVSSIIELFTSDTKLSKCQPELVVAEALKAASLKLPINKQLGFAYIIPYKGVPQFQMGYKGYIQLALRSGFYKYINADVVYEGELVKKNKLTGEIDLTGEKTSDKIIGFFAYLQLLNGYSSTFFMTYDEMVSYALRYSPSSYEGRLGGAWATNFNAMALKTCLKQHIPKNGIMSVEMREAFINDTSDVRDVDFNEPANIPDVEYNEPKPDAPDADVDQQTGEVIEQ